MMPSAIRKDLIIGGTVVIFALIVLFLLVPYGVDRPGQVDVTALSPNFWPTVLGIFLLLMGVIVIVQAVLRNRATDTIDTMAPADGPYFESMASHGAVPRTLAAVALLFVYYLVLNPLGMVAASVLAMFAFTLLAGERRWILIVPLAVLVPVALYLFFQEIAQVAIPVGLFEDMLG